MAQNPAGMIQASAIQEKSLVCATAPWSSRWDSKSWDRTLQTIMEKLMGFTREVLAKMLLAPSTAVLPPTCYLLSLVATSRDFISSFYFPKTAASHGIGLHKDLLLFLVFFKFFKLNFQTSGNREASKNQATKNPPKNHKQERPPPFPP